MSPADDPQSPDISPAIGERLLAWYERHGRDLPWRHTRDPYAIWVAETMLQQTQVQTVLPYYRRFLERFPTVGALAAASPDEVLKAWEGLGYYARARNLHAAARQIVAEGGEELPRTLESLQRLPGVGRYTAAAVASIAFGQDEVALDGNLVRVLSRLFVVDDDPSRPGTQRRLQELARAIMPAGRAGDANQAFMDLGATICTPAAPQCLICPLLNLCGAQAGGIQGFLPIRPTRRSRPHRDVTAAVIRGEDGRVLITQRPLDSLLGGLWEFPGGKCLPDESLPHCLEREIMEELDVEIDVGELLCAVDHAFTHFSMTLYAFDCRLRSGTLRCLACLDLRWVTLEQMDAFAFGAADLRIIEFLREQNAPGT